MSAANAGIQSVGLQLHRSVTEGSKDALQAQGPFAPLAQFMITPELDGLRQAGGGEVGTAHPIGMR